MLQLSDLNTSLEQIPISPIPAVNVATVPQRSPLRYPGGKTWLVPHVRAWLSGIRPTPEVLMEPFAGASHSIPYGHNGRIKRTLCDVRDRP